MIHWNSFADFLAMGGYGPYVWGSFGLNALIFILEPLLVRRRSKVVRLQLARRLRAGDS